MPGTWVKLAFSLWLSHLYSFEFVVVTENVQKVIVLIVTTKGACSLCFELHHKLGTWQDGALRDVWCAVHELIALHVLS